MYKIMEVANETSEMNETTEAESVSAWRLGALGLYVQNPLNGNLKNENILLFHSW